MMFRPHHDLFDQVGLYLNTVVYRNQFAEEDSFVSILEKIKANAIKSYAHKDYPFDQLIDDLNLQRDMSRNPLFDIMVVLNNNERVDAAKNPIQGITIKPYKIDTESVISKFDLTFDFTEVRGEFLVNIEYNTDLYKQETIERLNRHLHKLIDQIVEQPNASIADISLLSQQEEHQLLSEFNNTNTNDSNEKPLIKIFEEQAEKTPDKIAVVFENNKLTCKELNEISNQLGDYLRQTYNIQPDDLIAISLDRSEWMIIAILGVLKSGAAYVPVDPQYPQERLDYILNDSNAKALVDHGELTKFMDRQKEFSKSNLEITTTPNHLAYVIYTSGSTGKPKGVMLENRNLFNLLIKDDYSSSLTANFVFDASVYEIFTAILFGNTLFIPTVETVLSPSDYLNYIEENNIEKVFLLPFYVKQFSALFENKQQTCVKKILTGVESIHSQSIKGILDKNIHLTNAYGPAESTIYSSAVHIQQLPENSGVLPVGSPIQNTQIYILDDQERLLPIGLVGEICISGAGIARGYLNRPELTKEKFVSNPFIPGERMYKTGDMGKWLPDGNLVFVGRRDAQVKIRGYRIELGEIESTLLQKNAIQECVVLTNESAGDKQLVAFLRSEEQIDGSKLRAWLMGILPKYMVPSYFVQLEEFPLTTNGKLDKKALPNPINTGLITSTEYVAPGTDIEKQLVNIWSNVLGIEPKHIGIHNDFFALGGHSLKATKVISQISNEFSVKLTIKDIFTNTTIKKIAESIEMVSLANETEDTEDFDLVI